ncbi:hypothetical protein BBJ28_00021269 [Nothophytophthora sp. Chile5]|nr:hypothetical protein BBJ28_00021269 [Nothophytophthora sp. Chile5]
MGSEDHSAVMPVLQALVAVVRDGAFRDVLCFEESSTAEKPYDDAVLDRMIQACDGSIPTKGMLLGHLKYYLKYMYAVSPTEGRVFIVVSQLIHELEAYVDGQQSGASVDYDDVAVAIESEPTSVIDTSCILCKYNVSVRLDYLSTSLVKPAAGKRGDDASSLASTFNQVPPQKLTDQQFLVKLEREYDNFNRTIDLETFRHTNAPRKFTASDLYDAIGAAHASPTKHRSPAASAQRTELLNVMNDILLDTSCMISSAQLVALHKCLLPTSSGQGGVIRTDSAVGYASSRVYRVFLPASEISAALQSFVQAINRWKQRPLLCAYYAFAALVFYIHPFHDGNGRCARLLGNVVAKKLGYRPILRASDKTLQVGEFVQKTLVAMEIAHQLTAGSSRG